MDLLKLGENTVALSRDLLRVVALLSKRIGSVGETLQRIDRAFHGEDPGGEVQTAFDELGVAMDAIRDRFDQHRDKLRLLGSTLEDLGERSLDWLVSEDSPIEASEGDLSLGGSGKLAVTVSTDTDGETADGRIEFDATAERLLQISVRGDLEGELGAPRNLGTLFGTVGLEAGGSAEVVNYYRHSKLDDALPALLEDLTDFRLPGRLGPGSGRLRHKDEAAGFLLPAQWVQWTAQGRLGVSGSLSWSQSWVSSASLSHEGLEVDEVLPIRAGVGLGLDFSYRLSGFYDVLVRCADHDPKRVQVALHKRRRSDSHLGIDFGGQVEVQGLDRVGRSILGRFEPEIDKLLAEAARIEELSDLEGLLTRELDKPLDQLLEPDAIDEIGAGLMKLGGDPDLRTRLKTLARNRLLDVTEGAIDNLQQSADSVVDPFLELIEKVRKVQRKVHEALDKAARVKVAVTFAHERNRLRENEALLTFELDPVADPDLYRSMLLGNFEKALQSAGSGDNTLELKHGILRERGTLTIANDLNLTAFGITIGSGSIFHQDWDMEVTLQGDLTISLAGSLENIQRRWGRVRTFAFLADANLVSRAANLKVLEDPEMRHAVALEMTDRIERKFRSEIGSLERALTIMGVIPENTGIYRDLVADLEGQDLHQPVSFSVSLRPGELQLERLLSATPAEARRQLALALRLLDEEYQAIDRLDEEGQPLVIWPSVDRELEERQRQSAGLILPTTTALSFDSGGRSARVEGTAVQVLFTRWRWTRAVHQTFRQLHAIRGSQGELAGLDRERALQELRKMQKLLLQAARPILDNSILGSPRPHYAFFKAIFELAGGPSEELDPHLSALRKEDVDPPDGRILVFG